MEEHEQQEVDQLVGHSEQLSVPALHKLIGELNKLAQRRQKEAVKQARQEAQQLAKEYGISLNELLEGGAGTSGKGKGRSRGKVPPKYRHPENPDRTWTGRGRRPRWVQDYINSGGDIEELRIQD